MTRGLPLGAGIDYRLAPERAHDALDRHRLVRGQVAQPGRGVAPDQRERLDHRLVRGVVGAEFQRVEEPGHHAPVMAGVGAADRDAQAAAVHRSGLPLADQVAQGLLTGDGEHHVAHRAVGPSNGGAGDLEQQDRLARDPLQLVEHSPLDPALGAGADGVHGLDQELDQAVGERAAAQVDVGGEPGQARGLG